MKLFGLMTVRNAADLLSLNLRHHLAQGVERFLILDHASTDDTPGILDAFAAEGTVEWARVEGPFLSERWVNDLAREAYLQGADWVLPVDSDELWVAGGRRVVDLLRSSDAAALEVEVVNFVQENDQDDSVPEGLLRMVHRVARPVAYDLDGQRRVEEGALPFVALAYPPKFVARSSPSLRILRGNHGVSGLPGRVERRGDLVCLHAPLRSRAELERRRDPQAVLDPTLLPGQSWHLRRWVAMEGESALGAEWDANSAADGRLVASGTPLIVDTRLREAARAWLGTPPGPLAPGAAREDLPRGGVLGEGPVVAERARQSLEARRKELEEVREWGQQRRAEADALRSELDRLRAEMDRREAEAARRERDVAHRLEVLGAIQSSRFFRAWMATIRVRRALGWVRDRPETVGDPSPARLRRELDSRGFAAPVRIFDAAECRRLAERLRADPPASREWGKDAAVTCRWLYELAADERITKRVAAALGDEVVLWGASIAERPPGAEHPWHSDIETAVAEGTVSVWIGLEGTSRESGLDLVPYSHRFGVTLQQEARQAGRRRGEAKSTDVAAWARRRDRRSGVVRPELSDGDAIFFDGRLWHGSHNTTAATRTALLLQYAWADTPIRIPDLSRLEWPVKLLDEPLPPCLLVRGEPSGSSANRIVAPPPPATEDAGARPLPALARNLDFPLAGDPESGWKPHPLFAGTSPNLGRMSCHASVLEPERCPHPPHEHDEEEILIVLDGRAELVVVDAAGTERVHPIEPGGFAYYPAGQLHTLRTPGDSRATYLMFKWTGRELGGPERLATSVFPDQARNGRGSQTTNGFAPCFVFESPTRWLRRLHCHLSTVAPGGGYEAHIDDHDVALVLLEGTIETAGHRLSGSGVVYLPAGERHGMHNPGDGPARYLVFEFHGNSPHRLGY